MSWVKGLNRGLTLSITRKALGYQLQTMRICSDVLGMFSGFSFVRAVLFNLREIEVLVKTVRNTLAVDAMWGVRSVSSF